MFGQIIPAVAVVLMFIASVFVQNIPIYWVMAWWITGCLSAVMLSCVKGENFGGGIRYIISIMIVGCLGFTLVPFAIPATFLAIYLIPRKWEREAEKRDKRIVEWALAGYPQNEAFEDLWRR